MVASSALAYPYLGVSARLEGRKDVFKKLAVVKQKADRSNESSIPVKDGDGSEDKTIVASDRQTSSSDPM